MVRSSVGAANVADNLRHLHPLGALALEGDGAATIRPLSVRKPRVTGQDEKGRDRENRQVLPTKTGTGCY